MTRRECLKDIQLARVYHGPKDDLMGALVGPLWPTASIVRRLTGDIRSTVFSLLREHLLSFLEANGGGGKVLWLSSHKVATGDVDAVLRKDAFLFGDLMIALKAGPRPGEEVYWCRRILATLLHKGLLEWKVVRVSGGLFHEKGAIFDDRCGHRTFLSGSWNETLQAYTRNVERVDVHRGWEEEARCREAINWFENVWNGEIPGLEALPIEEAIKEGWIAQVEDEPWMPLKQKEPRPELWTPELLYLYIQDKLPPGLRDPFAGTLVDPHPHQVYVHQRVISRPPMRFLLADEVGLGKTIEAGMIISTLTGSGTARRVLILAPKNVLQQWRDELWGRFQLPSWTLEGKEWVRHDKKETFKASRPLFAHLPGPSPQIMLVSRSLAMRSERMKDFQASLWDIVVLDEAHRARSRREAGSYRANNLLKVLQMLDMRTTALLLLTATPVQLGLFELYDLLKPLGLPMLWTERESFEGFIKELGKEEPNWDFIVQMASLSEEFYRERHNLGLEEFDRDLTSGIQFFEGLPEGENPETAFRHILTLLRTFAYHEIEVLPPPRKELLKVALYRMSPLFQLVCRNTRGLLRLYRSRGLIDLRIPDREVGRPVEVAYTDEEATLYHDVIENYIIPYYQKYEKAGLPAHSIGFVLSIYAKRAASSWSALEKSLTRRLGRLEEALRTWDEGGVRQLFGSIAIRDLISEKGGEEEQEILIEGYDDVDEEERPKLGIQELGLAKEIAQQEARKVRELLDQLRAFTDRKIDTKKDALRNFINDLLSRRNGVIVFSQFKDTIDYLADDFLVEYSDRLAKYHGQGGEIWRGREWETVTKNEVEKGIESGKFKLLLATDAASEGLNLQALDSVVNYDLPWNPMRIEQRIGRVDRLNQVSPTVGAHVVLPVGTIEGTVYERCVHRLGLFKQALGPLQPILLEDYIRNALLKGGDVGEAVDKAVGDWSAARKHTDLYEKALASMSPDRHWATRQRIEREALEHLLAATGFQRDGECWTRGDLRLAIHKNIEGAEMLIAAPHNSLFVSILSELGPPPPQLSWDGNTYKLIHCGDRQVLAVEPVPGSGLFLVTDLTRLSGEGATQIGIDEGQVQKRVIEEEAHVSEALKKFRSRQEKVRRKEWDEEAERLFRDICRMTNGNIEKAAAAVLRSRTLLRLWQTYKHTDEEPIGSNVMATLSQIGEGTKRRGKKPKLENLQEHARELLEWWA